MKYRYKAIGSAAHFNLTEPLLRTYTSWLPEIHRN